MLKFLAPSIIALLLPAACAHEPTTTGQSLSADVRVARAYLEIALKVDPANRPAAAAVYTKYKQPFLDNTPGAISKELLIRDEDVVVLHGFDTKQHASDYLQSALFLNDVVVELKPLLAASPDVRIYSLP
jgi:hypothetical protein